MHHDIIEAAAATARPLNASNVSIADLNRRKESLTQAKSSLLPVESAAVAQCDAEIAEATIGINILKAKTGIKEIQLLDSSPLTWRNALGLPKLMPFDVTKSGTVQIGGKSGFSENFPEVLRQYYNDVQHHLSWKSGANWSTGILFGFWLSFTVFGTILGATTHAQNGWWQLGHAALGLVTGTFLGGFLGLMFGSMAEEDTDERFISASFSGFIPESTRRKIAATTGCFECVFILAEVPNIAILKRPVPAASREGDPLVVGALGGKLYLIDKFDTTTLEQHVADEYACKA